MLEDGSRFGAADLQRYAESILGHDAAVRAILK